LSPILLRPVREQLEHDRVIRLLQAKYKRKFEVAINPGNEQSVSVPVGQSPWYPDLVLQSTSRGRKLMGVVEVETAESVNNLEAMSQWASFARLRAPFHLYVPASSVDTAKRFCAGLQIPVAEIWAYAAIGDQMRFTLVHRSTRASEAASRAAASRTAASAGRRAVTAGRSRATRPAPRAPAAGGARRTATKKSGARAAPTRKTTSRSARTQKRK